MENANALTIGDNPTRRGRSIPGKEHPLAKLNAVYVSHILPDDLLSGRWRQWFDEFPELLHVIAGVVEVWKIRRPEELVCSDKIYDVGEGFFVGISGDPALSIEIITGLVLQRDSLS